MNSRFIFNHFVISDRLKITFLAILWIAGICLGIGLSAHYQVTVTQELQTDLVHPIPPFSFLTTALPLVLTAVFLFCNFSIGLYPLSFFLALCRGFSSYFIFSAFGDCGWLIRAFLLFSGTWVCVLFWWLLLRHCTLNRSCFTTDVVIAAVLFISVFLLDYFLVSPYLLRIFNYF